MKQRVKQLPTWKVSRTILMLSENGFRRCGLFYQISAIVDFSNNNGNIAALLFTISIMENLSRNFCQIV